MQWNELDKKAVAISKALAADAVEKVGNGHPGSAISLAPIAYTIYQKIMNYDPTDPSWIGRDRFVLSAGHASLLQYIQLYLAGYDLSLDDIKSLRTHKSKTPAHPEIGITSGVEASTGPLGAGLAMSVGMAFASRFEKGLFDQSKKEFGNSPFDHYIYCIAGDGDMQEGVSSEACSLAGTQELGNLIVIYDKNNISIEGNTNIAFTENVLDRFKAYGWHTQEVDWTNQNGVNGEYSENTQDFFNAVQKAKLETKKPSIICVQTIIGYPAPTKQNTGGIHGSKLGTEEVKALKKVLGLPENEEFYTTSEIDELREKSKLRGAENKKIWQKKMEQWQNNASKEQIDRFNRLLKGEMPKNWESSLPEFEHGVSMASRASSGKVLNAIKDVLPELWGGSADLAGSNNTFLENEPSFLPESICTKNSQASKVPASPYGRNLHFGIREHAMASIINGIYLHGNTKAYCGTFFVFSDYMRPAMRLSAIMQLPSIFVLTHDSIGVGEDGPTHQPVEHLASLRAMPNISVVRPCDANEVVYAWKMALESTKTPTALVLTRQDLPTLNRKSNYANASFTQKGAYILSESSDPNNSNQIILLASGSEVSLALDAQKELENKSIPTRVVSVPCIEWFYKQEKEYQDLVLPKHVKNRISIEAASSFGWKNLVGEKGVSIAVDDFGGSASPKILFEQFGLTVSNIFSVAHELYTQIN